MGESGDIIILYDMYIAEYAFTFEFNDNALATRVCNCTNHSVYTKHYLIIIIFLVYSKVADYKGKLM